MARCLRRRDAGGALRQRVPGMPAQPGRGFRFQLPRRDGLRRAGGGDRPPRHQGALCGRRGARGASVREGARGGNREAPRRPRRAPEDGCRWPAPVPTVHLAANRNGHRRGLQARRRLSLVPRVALDARTMQQEPLGGIGRGLANLIPLLEKDVDLVLLLDNRRPGIGLDVPKQQVRMPLTAKRVAWLQLAAPNWLRGFPGIFHSPFNGLPYCQPVPMVVTIHDISFVTHPQCFSASLLASFRAQARHAVKTARRILTVSEQARKAIIDFYRADTARILVAPNAVDPVFHPTSTEDRDSS